MKNSRKNARSRTVTVLAIEPTMPATPAVTQSATDETKSDTMVEAGGGTPADSRLLWMWARPASIARTMSRNAGMNTMASTAITTRPPPPTVRVTIAAAAPGERPLRAESVGQRVERGDDHRGQDDRGDDRAEDRGARERDDAEGDHGEQPPAEARGLDEPVGDERARARARAGAWSRAAP